MTRTIAITQTAADPTFERAEFFANLELLELTMVIPQAAPAQPVARY